MEPNSSTTYDATLITPYELRNCLKDMRKRAASGPDGIQIQHIIGLKDSIMEPLLLLYNSCLSFGFIPKCMKRAKVILIPKNKGDPHSINSLRSITITSCILKILDKILSSRLSHSLEKGGFLYKNQFGFRTSRSTDLLVSEFISRTSYFDKDHYVAVLNFDISSAFDTISYD